MQTNLVPFGDLKICSVSAGEVSNRPSIVYRGAVGVNKVNKYCKRQAIRLN